MMVLKVNERRGRANAHEPGRFQDNCSHFPINRRLAAVVSQTENFSVFLGHSIEFRYRPCYNKCRWLIRLPSIFYSLMLVYGNSLHFLQTVEISRHSARRGCTVFLSKFFLNDFGELLVEIISSQ